MAIVKFKLFDDHDRYISYHRTVDELSPNGRYFNEIYYCVIELPKFNKKRNELNGPFDQWLYFLKHGSQLDEEEVKEITRNNEDLEKTYKILEQLHNESDRIWQYWQLYKQRLSEKDFDNNGHHEGFYEGINKVARNMLQRVSV